MVKESLNFKVPLGRIPRSRYSRSLFDLVKEIPKIDLHFHGEGALYVSQYIQLAEKYGIPLPSKDPKILKKYLQASKQCGTLLDFIKIFDFIGRFFVSQDAVADFLYEGMKNAVLDNVCYLEMRFAPHYIASYHNLSNVMEAAIVARERGIRDFPNTVVNLIVIAVRNFGVEKAEETVDLALQYKKDGVVGVDLAADEVNYPPQLFCKVFKRAREEGLHVTIHAGEALGADSVKCSIEECFAERIGHGVRMIEDPDVRKMVISKKIPLEICLTSNVWLGAVLRGRQHPVKEFYDEHVVVTLNTDDPGIFGIDLTEEYLKALLYYNFNLQELQNILFMSNEVSFGSQHEKDMIKELIIQKFSKLSWQF